MLCPSSFSTTHTISDLFSCVKNIHKISQTKLGCLPGEQKGWKILGTEGVYINPISLNIVPMPGEAVAKHKTVGHRSEK